MGMCYGKLREPEHHLLVPPDVSPIRYAEEPLSRFVAVIIEEDWWAPGEQIFRFSLPTPINTAVLLTQVLFAAGLMEQAHRYSLEPTRDPDYYVLRRRLEGHQPLHVVFDDETYKIHVDPRGARADIEAALREAIPTLIGARLIFHNGERKYLGQDPLLDKQLLRPVRQGRMDPLSTLFVKIGV